MLAFCGVAVDSSKKKRYLLFFGSLFFAITFVSSYAAFGNNNTSGSSQSGTNTTVSNVQTYAVFGDTNAVVVGYGDQATVTTNSYNQSDIATVGNVLSALETNGTISNYIATNGTFDVLLSTGTPYSLQSVLYSQTGSNAIVSVNGTAYVTLPPGLHLQYKPQTGSTQSIPITAPSENFSISVMPVLPLNASVPVKVQALITATGQVYGNQIKVTPV